MTTPDILCASVRTYFRRSHPGLQTAANVEQVFNLLEKNVTKPKHEQVAADNADKRG
jgi:hypothetical protein